MTNIHVNNELIGAIKVGQASPTDLEKLQADPKSFLEANNFEVSGEVKTVQNNASEVHIALPFYSFIDEISNRPISDEELNEVAGGEMVFTGSDGGTYTRYGPVNPAPAPAPYQPETPSSNKK